MDARQIAISGDGRRVAYGGFQEAVEIWDIPSGGRVATLQTTLDFGGNRLVVSRDGSLIVTAAYARHGIAGYDASKSRLLWQRRDLKKAQHLSFAPSADYVYAGFESGSGRVLHAETGETLSSHRGVRRFEESSYDKHVFLDKARPIVVHADDWTEVFPFERRSFSVLSVAFSPTQVAVSEAGATVRCFELKDGNPAWTYTPKSGVHCLELVYSMAEGVFFGVLWNYAVGGDKQLVRISPEGRTDLVASVGRPASAAFDRAGSVLVTSERKVVDLSNGAVRMIC